MKAFPSWRDAMTKLAPAHQPSAVVPVERVDQSTLSERIGAQPRPDRAAAGDGIAPWRRALRTPPTS